MTPATPTIHLQDISSGKLLCTDGVSLLSTLLDIRLTLDIRKFQFEFLDPNCCPIPVKREHDLKGYEVALRKRRWMRGGTLKTHNHRLLLIATQQVCHNTAFTGRNDTHIRVLNNLRFEQVTVEELLQPDVYGHTALDYACRYRRLECLQQVLEMVGNQLIPLLSVKVVTMIIASGVKSCHFTDIISLSKRRFNASLLSSCPEALLFWHQKAPDAINWDSKIAFFTKYKSIQVALACCPMSAYPSERSFLFNLEEGNASGLGLLLSIPHVVVAVRASSEPILLAAIKYFGHKKEFNRLLDVFSILRLNPDYALSEVDFDSSISRVLLSLPTHMIQRAAAVSVCMSNKVLAVFKSIDYHNAIGCSGDGCLITIREDSLSAASVLKGRPILVPPLGPLPSFRSGRCTIPEPTAFASRFAFVRYSRCGVYCTRTFFNIWQVIISFMPTQSVLEIIASEDVQLGSFFLYVGASVRPVTVHTYPPPLVSRKDVVDLSLVALGCGTVSADVYSLTSIIVTRCKERKPQTVSAFGKTISLLDLLLRKHNSVRDFLSSILWKYRHTIDTTELTISDGSFIVSVVKKDDLRILRQILIVKSLRGDTSSMTSLVDLSLRHRALRIASFLINLIKVSIEREFEEYEEHSEYPIRKLYSYDCDSTPGFTSVIESLLEVKFFVEKNTFEDLISMEDRIKSMQQSLLMSVKYSNVKVFEACLNFLKDNNISVDFEYITDTIQQYRSWPILSCSCFSDPEGSPTISDSSSEDVLFSVIATTQEASVLKAVFQNYFAKQPLENYTLLKECFERAFALANWTAVRILVAILWNNIGCCALLAIVKNAVFVPESDFEVSEEECHGGSMFCENQFLEKCEASLAMIDNRDSHSNNACNQDQDQDQDQDHFITIPLQSTVLEIDHEDDADWLLDDSNSSGSSSHFNISQNFLFTQIPGGYSDCTVFLPPNNDDSVALFDYLPLKSKMILSSMVDALQMTCEEAMPGLPKCELIRRQRASLCLLDSLGGGHGRGSVPNWHRAYCLGLNKQHRYSASTDGDQPAAITLLTVKVSIDDVFCTAVSRVYIRQYSITQDRHVNIPSRYCQVILLEDTERRLFQNVESPKKVFSDYISHHTQQTASSSSKIPLVPVYVFSIWKGEVATLRWIIVYNIKRKEVTTVAIISLSREMLADSNLSLYQQPCVRVLQPKDLMWKALWDVPESAWDPLVLPQTAPRVKKKCVSDEPHSDSIDSDRIIVLKVPGHVASSSFDISLHVSKTVVCSWQQ
eukprot:TRINITY_DN9937_c0_g1_i1.p1 TRINITY_DN9937_c0_g1~~TRINITY_DN9937_c0_g1_i1.p1  ORF type:complete len:1264 (+),score=156.51 TRINITY_DN9937_c0_g1_i1:62-3853(+)